MAQAELYPFRILIRRDASRMAPFTVRFSVEDGRGLVRVSRPGVLVDSPAGASGAEESLTGDDLRACRFIHVSSQHGRRSFSLEVLPDAFLDAMPDTTWTELQPLSEDDRHYLVPLGTLDLTDSDIVPLSNTDEDEITNTDDRPHSQIKRVKDVLNSYSSRMVTMSQQPTMLGRYPSSIDVPTPRYVLKERSWKRDSPRPLTAPGHTAQYPYDHDVYLGDSEEDEIRVLMSKRLGELFRQDEPVEPPIAGLRDEDMPTDKRRKLGAVAAPAEEVKPARDLAAFVINSGAPLNGLMRHLRRQWQRDRAEIAALRARLARRDQPSQDR